MTKMTQDEEANEIVRRLTHGTPKYIIGDKPFTIDFWVTWPPKNEKQTPSKKEETCPGCRRDNASSSRATEE